MKTSRTTLFAAALLLGSTMAYTSCRGSKADPETEAAQTLLNQAREALEGGDFSTSLQLLDSIDSIYPNQLDIRREGLALRPQVLEKKTIALIQATDSAIAVNAEELDRISLQMKQISQPGLLEPYFVVSDAYNPSFISQTAVEPRVDSEGNYYIVAQVQGGGIGLNGVRLNTSTGSMTSETVTADRTIKEGGSELVSFRMEEVDSLGNWAFSRLADISSATLLGKGGATRQVNLTPKQARSFGMAWRYSFLRRQQRVLSIRREHLERALLTARTQIANTLQPTETDGAQAQ